MADLFCLSLTYFELHCSELWVVTLKISRLKLTIESYVKKPDFHTFMTHMKARFKEGIFWGLWTLCGYRKELSAQAYLLLSTVSTP